MQVSDLFLMGRLGSKIDEYGFIQIRKSDAFQPDFLSIRDVFLVFTDHRVRYVTVKEFREKHGKLFFSIEETEVMEELFGERNVKIMTERNFSNGEQNESSSLIGFQIVADNAILGFVEHVFDNGAHEILECKTAQQKDFMIPNVAFYIKKIDTIKRQLYVQNIDTLLTL